jgi:VCBS repeat protein
VQDLLARQICARVFLGRRERIYGGDGISLGEWLAKRRKYFSAIGYGLEISLGGIAMLKRLIASPALIFTAALMTNSAEAQAGGPFDREFYIKALGNRCVDFGPPASWKGGGPVFLYPCNGTISQRIRIKELADGSHDVELRAGSAFCIGARTAGRPAAGNFLELQPCDNSPRQRFAFDGDAFLIGQQSRGHSSRQLAMEPYRDFTPARTLLAVSSREVVDPEYFRVTAVDGSGAAPHSGFISVSSEADLDNALSSSSWGTVIGIASSFRLEGSQSKSIPAGVTLRGYRKYVYNGPELFRCTNSTEPAFRINQEDIRMTGFRLMGPDKIPCPWYDPPKNAEGDVIDVPAVEIDWHELTILGGPTRRDDRASPFDFTIKIEPRALIDHVEIGGWHGTGIKVQGPGPWRDPDGKDDYPDDCPTSPVVYPRETRVRAIGNFLHHLDPYGVTSGSGAFALARGNVAYLVKNHVIASDGAKTSGYVAYDNLFLTPSGGHELDIHGTHDPGHWEGGLGGNYFDIGWNTVLGVENAYKSGFWHGLYVFFAGDKVNFNLRGTPCLRVDLHENVFRRGEGSSIKSESVDGGNKLKRWGNIFNEWGVMNDLAVGDFDGDGIDDVFVGTGATWYFSSGGRAEWRLLNRMPEKASQLRFGDFDNDGRTDVVALHNGAIDVSWAGGSPWQTINVTAWQLTDLAVGDFDGDHYSDLFLATGSEWFVAPGGRNWAPYSPQSLRTPDLRFGDLTGDGQTDVVGQVNGKWAMLTRHGGIEHWAPLHASLSGALTGVVVANVTGDKRQDLLRSSGGKWRVSDAGLQAWQPVRSATVSGYGTITNLTGFPIGRFYDGNEIADVVFPSGTTGVHFDYAEGARDPVRRLSRQPMK